MGVQQSTIDMSKYRICFTHMPMFIAYVLKDVELESVVTPVSGVLFMIGKDNSLLEATHRKRFHSKVVQLLYLGKRIRMNILIAVTLLTTRVTKAIEEDDGRLLMMLKYDIKGHRGAVARKSEVSMHAVSTKQKVVLRSSFEAELNSLQKAIPQVIRPGRS